MESSKNDSDAQLLDLLGWLHVQKNIGLVEAKKCVMLNQFENAQNHLSYVKALYDVAEYVEAKRKQLHPVE
jgi:hypothetical protein